MQATGRLTWLPLCEYKGNGRIVSLTQLGKEMQVVKMASLSNQLWSWFFGSLTQVTQVTARRKTVDATLMETRVPATTKPNFTVEEGVNIVPVNGLSRLSRPWAR